jgi:UDP-glucose 4-epimerase
MTRILVTGGSGFIGRNLAPGLAALGYEVLVPSHAELELLDSEAVHDYLRLRRPDVVVHGATKPAHRNAKDLTGIVETNERMFFNLVRDAELCPRMVFLSSGAVYGADRYVSRMPETYFDAHVPIDEHGFSKYVIAKYIEVAEHITELRIFGVFGPHEDYAIRFISNAICKTLLGLPVTLRQDREFDYLWIDDLTPVVAHFVENLGEYSAYNVTPDETSSLKALGELVIRLSGTALPLEIAASGLGTPYSGDSARLRNEMPDLAFTPREVAIRAMFEWYSERRDSIDVRKLLVDR